jgi:hypothetical protein
MRLALTIPLALASMAALLVAGSASARPASCTAGMTTVKGVQARVFCGSATAHIKIGGKSIAFTNGACAKTSDYVSINIGTLLLGRSKAMPEYFGLNVGKMFGSGKAAGKDGNYQGGALAVEHAGTGYAVQADTIKVNLAGGRSKGTFSGKLLTGGAFSGTFSC